MSAPALYAYRAHLTGHSTVHTAIPVVTVQSDFEMKVPYIAPSTHHAPRQRQGSKHHCTCFVGWFHIAPSQPAPPASKHRRMARRMARYGQHDSSGQDMPRIATDRIHHHHQQHLISAESLRKFASMACQMSNRAIGAAGARRSLACRSARGLVAQKAVAPLDAPVAG